MSKGDDNYIQIYYEWISCTALTWTSLSRINKEMSMKHRLIAEKNIK